jgi:hypothetical protein
MSPFEHLFQALFFPCFSALTFYVYHSTVCISASVPRLCSYLAKHCGSVEGGGEYRGILLYIPSFKRCVRWRCRGKKNHMICCANISSQQSSPKVTGVHQVWVLGTTLWRPYKMGDWTGLLCGSAHSWQSPPPPSPPSAQKCGAAGLCTADLFMYMYVCVCRHLSASLFLATPLSLSLLRHTFFLFLRSSPFLPTFISLLLFHHFPSCRNFFSSTYYSSSLPFSLIVPPLTPIVPSLTPIVTSLTLIPLPHRPFPCPHCPLPSNFFFSTNFSLLFLHLLLLSHFYSSSLPTFFPPTLPIFLSFHASPSWYTVLLFIFPFLSFSPSNNPPSFPPLTPSHDSFPFILLTPILLLLYKCTYFSSSLPYFVSLLSRNSFPSHNSPHIPFLSYSSTTFSHFFFNDCYPWILLSSSILYFRIICSFQYATPHYSFSSLFRYSPSLSHIFSPSTLSVFSRNTYTSYIPFCKK